MSTLHSAHACTQPTLGEFTYAPRAPHTPEPGPHAWQRRYGPANSAYGMQAQHDAGQQCFCRVEVFRDAKQDMAELNIRIGINTCASITVRLTPAELREVAARLIDAAHDIETLPAATLAREQEGGAA